MLLGVTIGRRAVNAKADAVIGLGKILKEVKGRVALPCLEVNLLSVADHNFFHTRMLNRRGLLPDSAGLFLRGFFSQDPFNFFLRDKLLNLRLEPWVDG